MYAKTNDTCVLMPAFQVKQVFCINLGYAYTKRIVKQVECNTIQHRELNAIQHREQQQHKLNFPPTLLPSGQYPQLSPFQRGIK